MASSLSDPNKSFTGAHVNWGRASAHQMKRVSADSDWESMHMVNFADDVSAQFELCRVSDEVPHFPISGTWTAPASSGKCRMDLPFRDDGIALRAIDIFSKFPLLIPMRPKHP